VGILQVNHIRSYLEANFVPLLDASDLATRAADDRQSQLLSRAVAAFALSSLVGVDPRVACDAVVDGFDDNGIDAVFHDTSERMLYLVQSKWVASGNGSPDRGEIQRFIKGVRDLVEPRLDRFNKRLRDKSQEILQALDDVSVTLVLVVAHTGQQPLSSHVASDLKDLLDEINDTSEAARLRVLTQKEFHAAVSARVKGEGVSVELLLREWGHTTAPYGAYYGQVDASDLAPILFI
jgi:hypothetical protein